MTAQEFLQSKHLLREGETKYPINGPRGSVDLVELLEEYKGRVVATDGQESPKKKPQSKQSKKA